jgi:hypothetical protein
MENSPTTKRIKANEKDLDLIRLRDQATQIAGELKALTALPANPERTSLRAALESKLNAVRREMMNAMSKTNKLA